MSIKNERQFPKVFYGLHFYPGTAEYQEPGKEPYRIFLNENTLRKMDSTFEGKPVYVRHVDEVNLTTLKQDADGYVVRSFYNEVDGKHWVEFMVVSDKGHNAIRQGWKLSNAYVPTAYAPGGTWNGIEFTKEITDGTYEHLALVDDPRYNESIVLDKQQFKEYNESHRQELRRVANDKSKGIKHMFDLFKKTKVETDLTDMTVKLPTSGKEVTIAELIASADKAEVPAPVKNDEKSGEAVKAHTEHKGDGEKNPEEEEKQGRKEEETGAAPQMANMDHHVSVGGKTMSLKEHMANHEKMHSALKGLYDCMSSMHNAELDGGEKEAEEQISHEDKTKRNDEEMDSGEKEGMAQKKEADKTKKNDAASDVTAGFLGATAAGSPPPPPPTQNDLKHFETLKNAPLMKGDELPVFLDRVERGKSRYGSN